MYLFNKSKHFVIYYVRKISLSNTCLYCSNDFVFNMLLHEIKNVFEVLCFLLFETHAYIMCIVIVYKILKIRNKCILMTIDN